MIESRKFHLIKYLMIAVAVLQLALSQYHIAAISVLFVREIGFYLFLFILMSLILMAILFSFNEWSLSSALKMLILSLGTASAGGYTLLLMIKSTGAGNRAVAFDSISLSVVLLLIAIVAYVVGAVLLFLVGQHEFKGEAHG